MERSRHDAHHRRTRISKSRGMCSRIRFSWTNSWCRTCGRHRPLERNGSDSASREEAQNLPRCHVPVYLRPTETLYCDTTSNSCRDAMSVRVWTKSTEGEPDPTLSAP